MKRPRLMVAAALCGSLLTLAGSVPAQTAQPFGTTSLPTRAETADGSAGAAPVKNPGGTAGELDALRQRLEEVEGQNRVLAESLRELKSRLDELSPPAAAGNSPTSVLPRSGATPTR